MAERLCEVKAAMRPVLQQLVKENNGQPLKIGHTWSLLECPVRGGHCEKFQACKGFTRENRLRIAAINNHFFTKGFVKDEL